MLALLSGRYGDALASRWESVQPLVVAYVAAAIDRRFMKANALAESETNGPFSVRWSSASTTGAWFLDAELADLDRLLGKGGSRTYRTPAPDAIRSLNPLTVQDLVRGSLPAGVEYAHHWEVDDV